MKSQCLVLTLPGPKGALQAAHKPKAHVNSIQECLRLMFPVLQSQLETRAYGFKGCRLCSRQASVILCAWIRRCIIGAQFGFSAIRFELTGLIIGYRVTHSHYAHRRTYLTMLQATYECTTVVCVHPWCITVPGVDVDTPWSMQTKTILQAFSS